MGRKGFNRTKGEDMTKRFDEIGDYIKLHRSKAGLSQLSLATFLGYDSGQFISNCERGLCTLPLKKFILLTKACPSASLERISKLLLNEEERYVRKMLKLNTKKKSPTHSNRSTRSSLEI